MDVSGFVDHVLRVGERRPNLRVEKSALLKKTDLSRTPCIRRRSALRSQVVLALGWFSHQFLPAKRLASPLTCSVSFSFAASVSLCSQLLAPATDFLCHPRSVQQIGALGQTRLEKGCSRGDQRFLAISTVWLAGFTMHVASRSSLKGFQCLEAPSLAVGTTLVGA